MEAAVQGAKVEEDQKVCRTQLEVEVAAVVAAVQGQGGETWRGAAEAWAEPEAWAEGLGEGLRMAGRPRDVGPALACLALMQALDASNACYTNNYSLNRVRNGPKLPD